MVRFIRSRLASFSPALAGWWHVLRNQKNTWIHAILSLVVFALGSWLRLGHLEWAIIILTVVLVWMAEFINTALEAIVDLASPEDHPLAKVGKDIGAAAVLICAAAAVVIGLLVLGPPLLARLNALP
jgi:diacylglycerol kinase